MKIIMGLGNPGKEYEETRHNVGFKVLDLLHEKLEFEEFKEKKKFKALVSEGNVGDEKVLLVKPLTFMNLSGESALALINYYEVPFNDFLVVYDDLDFAVGELKIKENGGAGSHNGMKSVIELLKTENFPRIRIGIESRTITQKHQFAGKDFVLSHFKGEESKIMEKVFEKATNAGLKIIRKQ